MLKWNNYPLIKFNTIYIDLQFNLKIISELYEDIAINRDENIEKFQ